MSNGTSSLQLEYSFTPDPSPIYASYDGENPNTVDLGVMVSNATEGPITLEKIQITIPVGSAISSDLSTATSLPSPVYDTQAFPNLSITSSGTGGVVTIQNSNGSNLIVSVTQPLAFNLPGIAVNNVVGTVPITVTEYAQGGQSKVIDDTTYALTKLPGTMPVTDFWAEPATLFNLEQTVMLKWSCNSLGSSYSYNLSGPNWLPRDCINSGVCYSVQDGVNGVTSPQVDQTTIFSLDVVQAQSGGSRTIVGTLNTTVPVLMPTITDNSYQTAYFSGRLLRLNWLATNASTCTVSLDDQVIDGNAPVDTYLPGYIVQVSGAAGPHQLSVTALAQSGPAQAQFTFPLFTSGIEESVTVADPPTGLAITPDGALGLVLSMPENTLTFIDLASGQVNGSPISVISPRPIGASPQAIAITPDGSLALITIIGLNVVAVVDIAARTVESTTINVGTNPQAIAITPDGTLALVVNYGDGTVTVIDIASRTESNTIPVGLTPQAIAITPDGTLALVPGGEVTVIDIASRTAEKKTIRVGRFPFAIAITPDGTLAVVVNYLDNDVSLIDIANRHAESATISIGCSFGSPLYPQSLAITPDGSMALVLDYGNNAFKVIDVANWVLAINSIPVGTGPFAITVAPDGSTALVANVEGSTVSLF